MLEYMQVLLVHDRLQNFYVLSSVFQQVADGYCLATIQCFPKWVKVGAFTLNIFSVILLNRQH
jgi:hypothetical protein